MAIAEDTTGRRKYELRVKDIGAEKFLSDCVKNTSGAMAWSLDGQYLFYVLREKETLLPYQVYRHKIGDKQTQDQLVYEEKDETFYVTVGNSRSMKYIEIDISSTTSSETLLIDASNPKSEPIKVLEREDDHLYSVEDDADRLLILTNWQAKNFRLIETSLRNASKKSNWKELVPHRGDVLLQSFLAYPSNIVLLEREKGLRQIRVMSSKGKLLKKVKFNDPAYSTYFAANPEYDSKKLYFGYTSMRTPESVYSYDLVTGRRKLLKQAEVLGTFSPSVYKVERKAIEARDGTKVPVSLVYKRDLFKRGKNPLLVYGYGSYGNSIDPGFSSTRLTLLDRGFVFAIAHVRGGQELGRQWYEDGKMFKKLNTFYDFIDVTKGLIKQGYADQERVYAAGGSAGGMLMGAIMNMEPELYNGIISNVPFVDIITTMSDPSIPLTTGEYDEWGNPENQDEFEYIMQYSPYDNIDDFNYPSTLVTAGLWDSQVQYYEPAKYVAKLREFNKSNNPVLMKVNLSAGHSGVSGRFASLEEVAMEYAFLLRIDKNQR
jgi:oligopeptidase B